MGPIQSESMKIEVSDTKDRPTCVSDAWPRARRATSLLFLADGIGFGIWAALLPFMQTRLALSDAQLGGAMLAMVAGAVLAMLLIGRIVSRHGSPATLAIVAPLFLAILCGPVIAPTYVVLVIAAAAFGALKGAFDVSVNAQAIAVEKSMGRPIMATFQALWSIGGLGAALLAGLALKAGAAPHVLTIATATVLLIVVTMLRGGFVNDTQSAEAAATGGTFNARALQIGLLAFVALFTEGVMMDWSAVYARNVAGAEEWLAPIAYGVFCCSMATGRLAGDRLVARLSAARLLKVSGTLTVAGIIIMVAVQHWPVTFAGLLVAGLGLANLVPIFLTAAGSIHPGAAGRGVAAVSTIGYAGFLAGPPIIGGLSGPIGLPAAFVGVALLATLIGAAGPALLSRRTGSARHVGCETEIVAQISGGGSVQP